MGVFTREIRDCLIGLAQNGAKMDKKHTISLVSLFGLAALLRVGLALVNRQSNDNHMEVVQLILKRGILPSQHDCWECFQPKLYHFTVATLLKTLPITQPIIVAQLLNVVMSLVMLWMLWMFMRRVKIANDTVKVLAFGLFALNPAMVGINIQATNDTFAIAFSVLAFYFAYRMVDSTEFHISDLVFSILFTSLAVVSKTNCLVTALAIFCTLVFKAFADRDFSLNIRHGYLPRAALFAVFVTILVVFNPVGQYRENYKHYGSPVLLKSTVIRQPFPQLFEQTPIKNAGILSIQDGFFTFKLLDLLQTPQVTTNSENYPASRTSFWTILYGGSYFLHYKAYPPSWVTNRTEEFLIGQLSYILGLLPTLAILLGFTQDLILTFTFVLHPGISKKLPMGAGLFLIAQLGYLAFLILYALEYRMYSFMKVIFIYPAIPSFIIYYLCGTEIVHQLVGDRKWIKIAFNLATAILIGLFLLDATLLFAKLA
jgi:hypothetical protein